MPEGDTIHRTADGLRRALTGGTVRSFEARRLVQRGPEPGTQVDGVEARGKHLLLHFDDGTTLHTHLRMQGTWHVYRPGEPWRKSRSAARAVLETELAVAVCFSAPVVELFSTADVRRHPALRRLGPDLCIRDPDLDEALRRLDGLLDPDEEIGVALLDQRVASGIGNVYKSEVLFACGVHPSTSIGDLDPRSRRELLATAARMLRENLDAGPRRTTAAGTGPRLAVYGRAGRPCPRCRSPIRSSRQGDAGRTTSWCPSCQSRT